MIEINLSPRSNARSGRRSGAGLAAAIAGLRGRVNDPYLTSAIGSLVLAVFVVGALHLRHTTRTASLTETEQQAVQDSTRYAAVLKEKYAAAAQRDSILKQLDIIKSIDDERFVWPHVLEEVSRALPAYTWLVSINQTSAVVSAAARADTAAAAATRGAPPPTPATPVADLRAVRFRLVGQTVDIQALTRFMKLLEASPFIQNVQLARSDAVASEGKQVTEFQLDAEYEPPAAGVIQTIPVTLSVR
ncbi:MAG: PilN domain-containing protein [Gemmatimonadaceae bacterium]